jgi:hypothetical protein
VITIPGTKRQISLGVLVAFIASLSATIGGTWIAWLHQWGNTDPSVWFIAGIGLVGTTITAALHTWDTMPGNTAIVLPGIPIFGKRVSVVVLISFVVALATTVSASWIAWVHNFGQTDPTSLAIAGIGLLMTTVTAAIHIWDSMPNNAPVHA